MVSTLFADTVRAKGSANLHDDSHHLREPPRQSRNCAGTIRVQHTPHRMTYVQSTSDSDLIDIGGSFRGSNSARMTVPLLNLWGTTVSTAAREMFNNGGNSTHLCCGPCPTSNQPEQTCHEVAHKPSSRRGIVVGLLSSFLVVIRCE